MELLADRLIPASIERTWEALNDPEVLRRSMPGCESLERTGEDAFTALLALRVGPVNARFKGNLRLTNVTPMTGYDIQFDGQGGVAGFGKGSAQVQLAPEGADQTRLRYTAQARVGGKIAQVGSRLVNATAAKMADDFFKRFEEVLSEDRARAAEAAAPAAVPATATAAPAMEPNAATMRRAGPWIAAAAVSVAAVLYLFFR